MRHHAQYSVDNTEYTGDVTWPSLFLVALYCGLIFWLSSQPDPPVVSGLFPQFDKLQHIIAFGLLSSLVLTGMIRSSWQHPLWRLVWIPFAFTVGFGLVDEIHQHFVPGRNVDPFDIVANATGSALAQFLFLHLVYGHSRERLVAALRFRHAE